MPYRLKRTSTGLADLYSKPLKKDDEQAALSRMGESLRRLGQRYNTLPMKYENAFYLILKDGFIFVELIEE